MSEDEEFSISDLRRKRDQALPPGGAKHGPTPPPSGGDTEHVIYTAPVPRQIGPPPPGNGPRRPAADEEEESQSEWSVDVWRVLAALKRHWKWLAIGAVALGLVGGIGGYLTGKYSASIDLVQIKTAATPAFQPEAFSPATLVKLIQSLELVRRVAAKAKPPVDYSELADSIQVDLPANTELTTLTIYGQNADTLTDLVNLYAQETVDYTREMQLAGAVRSIDFYKEKVSWFDEEVARKNAELGSFLSTNNIIDPEAQTEAYTKQVADLFTLQLKKEGEEQLASLTITSLETQLQQLNPLAEQLAAANARLVGLQARYKDEHPLVQDVLAEIAAIQARIRQGGTNSSLNTQFAPGSLASSIQRQILDLRIQSATLGKEIEQLRKQQLDINKTVSGISGIGLKYSAMRGELTALTEGRRSFAASLGEAQMLERRAEGFFRINTRVTRDDVNTKPRLKSAVTTGFKGCVGGLLIAAALVFLVEMKHRTMKTVAEVERITGLRVLATLGDLNKMTEAEQDKWAFRTWTIIAGQLNMSANRGMVCGVMSSEHGEGRSTWIRLLGNAASRRGLRVLTVATKPSVTKPEEEKAETAANERSFAEAIAEAMADSAVEPAPEPSISASQALRHREPDYMALDEEPLREPETLSPSVLAFPAEVTQKFNSGGLPAAHIPLPGWVWSLERRRQWQNALTHWRSVDNLVLLVELPPASVPESVLLAENLPQILWLVDSGKPDIRETKLQLEMLHHARCRIVGAVLNHEPDPIIKL